MRVHVVHCGRISYSTNMEYNSVINCGVYVNASYNIHPIKCIDVIHVGVWVMSALWGVMGLYEVVYAELSCYV